MHAQERTRNKRAVLQAARTNSRKDDEEMTPLETGLIFIIPFVAFLFFMFGYVKGFSIAKRMMKK